MGKDLRDEELEQDEEEETENEVEEEEDEAEWDLGYDDDDDGDEEEEEEWVPYVVQLKQAFSAERRHGFRRSGPKWVALSIAMVADAITTGTDTVSHAITSSIEDILEAMEIQVDTHLFTRRAMEQRMQNLLDEMNGIKQKLDEGKQKLDEGKKEN